MRICQRKVKKQFKRFLSKPTLEAAVAASPFARHQWCVAIHERNREGGDAEYPFPPYQCTQDEVTEHIAHHVSMNRYTCPAQHYTIDIGVEKSRINRLVDSTGLVEECVVFETNTEPHGAKDLKRYEVRHGTKTTGISNRRDDDLEEEEEMNPQDGGRMTTESEQNQIDPILLKLGMQMIRLAISFRLYPKYRRPNAILTMISYASTPMNRVTLNIASAPGE